MTLLFFFQPSQKKQRYVQDYRNYKSGTKKKSIWIQIVFSNLYISKQFMFHMVDAEFFQKWKQVIVSSRVVLIHTSKDSVFLHHCVQTLTCCSIFICLTLFHCWPVLNPSSLTKHILVSVQKEEKVLRELHKKQHKSLHKHLMEPFD